MRNNFLGPCEILAGADMAGPFQLKGLLLDEKMNREEKNKPLTRKQLTEEEEGI